MLLKIIVIYTLQDRRAALSRGLVGSQNPLSRDSAITGVNELCYEPSIAI